MGGIDNMDDSSVGGGVIGNHTMRIRPTDSNPHTHLNTTEYTSTAMEIEPIVVFLCPIRIFQIPTIYY